MKLSMVTVTDRFQSDFCYLNQDQLPEPVETHLYLDATDASDTFFDSIRNAILPWMYDAFEFEIE